MRVNREISFELMLILRSEDIAVNFNGTKNVDPAIIMTELQNIESLDKIMSLLKVSYITVVSSDRPQPLLFGSNFIITR